MYFTTSLPSDFKNYKHSAVIRSNTVYLMTSRYKTNEWGKGKEI